MRYFAPLLLSAVLAIVPAASAHEGHVHETYDVAAADAPRITAFSIERDPAGGWIVAVEVENFTFVEDGATELPPGNVGHVHLYINGTEFGMFYAARFHIDELPFGPLDFKAVLSSPDHADYAVNGRAIEATTTITVE